MKLIYATISALLAYHAAAYSSPVPIAPILAWEANSKKCPCQWGCLPHGCRGPPGIDGLLKREMPSTTMLGASHTTTKDAMTIPTRVFV